MTLQGRRDSLGEAAGRKLCPQSPAGLDAQGAGPSGCLSLAFPFHLERVELGG